MDKTMNTIYTVAVTSMLAAELIGCGAHSVLRHRADTLKRVEESGRVLAGEAAGAAKSGNEMIQAADSARTSGGDEKSLATFDRAVAAYGAYMERLRRRNEEFKTSVTALQEAVQDEKEHWAEIVQGIREDKLRMKHQRLMDSRMRKVEKYIEASGKQIEELELALQRGQDIELAAASTREDASTGRLGNKLQSLILEIRQAQMELGRAAGALLAQLPMLNEPSAEPASS